MTYLPRLSYLGRHKDNDQEKGDGSVMATKMKTGFSVIPKERQREIASKGGKAAHALGTAHKFIKGSTEAKEAGKKGGAKMAAIPGHMSALGRLGGLSRAKKLQEIPATPAPITEVDPEDCAHCNDEEPFNEPSQGVIAEGALDIG